MKRKKEEVIPGDKTQTKIWLIFVALYLAFLLWLEPLIDFLLMTFPVDRSHDAIEILGQQKRYVVTIAFGIARSLPILIFIWLGLKITQELRLPPKGLRLPFAIRLIEGARAKTIGISMVAIGLLMLLREVSMLVSVQPVI